MKLNRILMLFAMIGAVAGMSFAAEDAVPPSDAAPVLAIHVENGTQGGQVPQGTPLAVYFYRGSELLQQTSGLTDAQGNCTIQNIPVGNDIAVVAQARHSDMAFSSAPLLLTQGQKRYELSFRVFDIAYGNSIIRAGAHHIIIKQDGAAIKVDEYLQLVNESDRAVLSDQKDAQGRYKVIELSLPVGFSELAFSDYFHADAVVQTADGFYDTMAMPPGNYNAVFAYNLPVTTGGLDFTKKINLQTGRLMVFVQNPGLTATGLGAPVGNMTLNDGTSVDYYTVDAALGSVLQFNLGGRPAPQHPQENNWVVLGILFAVVVLLALFRFVKIKPNKAFI